MTMTYGAQTWALTKANVSRLRSTQRVMERSMLGVKRRETVENEAMREETRLKDIGDVVKSLQ